MKKKPFIFLVFSCFCLSLSIVFSAFALNAPEIEEHSPLQPPRHQSINATNKEPTCKQKFWRFISCCYRCPSCCEACEDPDIIGYDSLGSPIYNSNGPLILRVHLPKNASDTERQESAERLRSLNRNSSILATLKRCFSKR